MGVYVKTVPYKTAELYNFHKVTFGQFHLLG